MIYQITESGDVVTVALEGALNFAVNEDFQVLLEKLVGMKPRQVVFNLAGLSGIDSVGLGLLHIASEDLSGMKARVCLKSPRESVARLLDLTEADKTFEIVP